MAKYEKYLLVIVTLVVFLPFVWIWLFAVLVFTKHPEPAGLLIIFPPVMGLAGLGLLLHAVLMERTLEYPYFTFFLVGAGCVPFLAFLLTADWKDFVSLEAFLSYVVFLLPIAVVIYLSYLYFSKVNTVFKPDTTSRAKHEA